MTDADFYRALALEAFALGAAFGLGHVIYRAIDKRRRYDPWCGQRHLGRCEAQRSREADKIITRPWDA